MTRVLYGLIVSVCISACASPHPPSLLPSKAAAIPHHAIVIIPGFKGSELATEDGETVWITASEALFGSRSLALPAPGIADPGRFHPTEVLRSVSLFGVSVESFYGPFLDEITERCADDRIVEFAYDWRLSVMEVAKQLSARIQSLKDQGITSIDLVAHSYGGLIVSWFLRFGDQDPVQAREHWNEDSSIRKVVLAGVPFRGAFSVLHDLKFGSTQGLNSTILNEQALSSIQSIFDLLPIDDKTLFSKAFDPIFWRENKLGLFSTPSDYDKKVEYIGDALYRALTFKRRLLSEGAKGASDKQKDVLIVLGERSPTAALSPDTTDPFEPEINNDGDGTLPATSALPPAAYLDHFTTRTIYTDLPHYRLLEDVSVTDFVCGHRTGSTPQ